MTKITKSAFGEFEGKPVERYTLSEGEMSVSVLTYGGILQSIVLPDKFFAGIFQTEIFVIRFSSAKNLFYRRK